MVLDASALLVVLQSEPGADRVTDALSGEVSISAANLAEVLGKLVDLGLDTTAVDGLIRSSGVVVESVTGEDARTTGRLRSADRAHGRPVLSLGDRFCLALAARLGVAAMTADRAWSSRDVGVEILQIR